MPYNTDIEGGTSSPADNERETNLMSKLETIQTAKDGSKKMKFNGIEFSVNNYNKIMHADNWNVTTQLQAAGLVNRNFYKHLHGHIDYTLVQ